MSDLPDIKTHSPVDPKINRYIDYYYFLDSQSKKECFEFLHYPHFKSTLVIFKNAEINVKENVNYISSSHENNYRCIYNNNVSRVHKEIVVGPYNIVGIVFNPLGFNYFQGINAQDPVGLFKSYLDEIFASDSIASRLELLDDFFGKMLQDFKAPVLEKAIELLMNRKGNIDLSELEILLDTNRRSILRYFKLHLGCSFRDFKTVLKFRIALKQGVLGTKKLSDLAYDSNYFDQSDLIKGFKSKSNETPGKLLKKITPVTEKLLWTFNK